MGVLKGRCPLKFYGLVKLFYVKLLDGVISVDDIYTYGHELLNKGYMTSNTIEYVNMSQIKDFAFNYSTAHKLIAMHDKWLKAGWYGSYYYAPRDVHLGIINMVASIIKLQPGYNLPEGIMIPGRENISPEDIRYFLETNRNL